MLLILALMMMSSLLYCNDTVTKRKIDNLTTFAKVYGYIRYFYPGDEAQEIDWDKFAIYGCKKVIDSRNDKELMKNINHLISTMTNSTFIYHIYTNPNRSLINIKPPNEGDYSITHWQYNGIYLNKIFYDSKRTNRYFKIRKDPTFNKKIAVLKFKKELLNTESDSVRLSVMAFTESNHTVQSKISLDYGSDEERISISKELHPQQWQSYDFEFQKNQMINNDCLIWFSDFDSIFISEIKLEEKIHNEWTIVKIYDFINENLDSCPTKLTFSDFFAKNTDYLIKKFHEKKVLKIANSVTTEDFTLGFNEEIFPYKLQFPESIDKSVSKNLKLFMPLTLYCTRDHTYPELDKNALLLLNQELKEINNQEFNINTALSSVIIYWNLLQHFYPNWIYTDNNWDNELRKGIEKALKCKNEKDILFVIKEMGSYTKDAHCYIDNDRIVKRQALPFRIDWIDNKWIVKKSLIDEVKSGYEVLKIDQMDFYQFMNENRKYHEKASEHGTLANLISSIIPYYENPNPEFLFKTTDNEIISKPISLKKVLPYDNLSVREEKIIEYPDGIFYLNLNINKLKDKDLDSLYSKLKDANGLILDLRYFPGVSINFIGHLMKEKSKIKDFFRQYMLYPDRDRVINGEKRPGWPIEPLEPYLNARIVVLSSNLSQSYCESFIEYLRMNRLATIIGQKTTGSTGNVMTYTLPGNIQVIWTGLFIENYDGTRFHGIGVIPDVEVNPTISGVTEGRDEILDKALEFIRD